MTADLLSEIIQDANSLAHQRNGDLLLQRMVVFVEHLMMGEGRR